MSTSETVVQELADRVAIGHLVDAWAHCADRREPERQAALFVPEGVVGVYAGDPATNEPLQRLQGHTALAEAFKVLDAYDATTHLNGQSTITFQDGQAAGETTAWPITCGSRTGSGPSW